MIKICILFVATTFACSRVELGSGWQTQGFVDWSCDSLCTASLPITIPQQSYYQINLNVSVDQAFGKEIYASLAGDNNLIQSCDLLPAEINPYVIAIKIKPWFRGYLNTHLNLAVQSSGSLRINEISLYKCQEKQSALSFFLWFGACFFGFIGLLVLVHWITTRVRFRIRFTISQSQ